MGDLESASQKIQQRDPRRPDPSLRITSSGDGASDLDKEASSHGQAADNLEKASRQRGAETSGGASAAEGNARQMYTAAAEAASEEVQIALTQLQTAPQASREVLQKMLCNILRSPSEAKFRKVRLANPRIKEAIVDTDGALELLQVGFWTAKAHVG